MGEQEESWYYYTDLMLTPHVSLMRSWLWCIGGRDRNRLLLWKEMRKEKCPHPQDQKWGRLILVAMLLWKATRAWTLFTKTKLWIFLCYVFWCFCIPSSCLVLPHVAAICCTIWGQISGKRRRCKTDKRNRSKADSCSRLSQQYLAFDTQLNTPDHYITLLPAGRTNKLTTDQSLQTWMFPVKGLSHAVVIGEEWEQKRTLKDLH